MEAAPAASTRFTRALQPRVTALTFSAENPRMRRLLATTAAGAAVAALALVQSGAAGPGSLGAFFFGPKLVRAEVVLVDGGRVHDYRVDRGRIRSVSPGSLTLRERDGTFVTVPVSPTADVRAGGVAVALAQLRRGLLATTVRDGDAPATIVQIGR